MARAGSATRRRSPSSSSCGSRARSLAALVGAALAASGATFQALLRNPLAEPYILGVSGGAAVGAVLAIVLGLAARRTWACRRPLSPARSSRSCSCSGSPPPSAARSTRACCSSPASWSGAFFNACILLALTFSGRGELPLRDLLDDGQLRGRHLATARRCCAPTSSRRCSSCWRSPDRSTCSRSARRRRRTSGVGRARRSSSAFGVASLLAAAAVAVSGVIGFVGLVIPHVVRLLWGSDHRFLIPASALLGAAFLVLADAARPHRRRPDRAARRRGHRVHRRAVLHLAAAAEARVSTARIGGPRPGPMRGASASRYPGAERPAVDGVSLGGRGRRAARP